MTHCRVDLAHQRADWGNGTVFSLTTREAELLAYLSSRPSNVVSREELYRSVWGYHSSTLSRAVDTAIKRLREKIEVNPTEPQHIFTVHGVGYRFEPSERPVEPLLVERIPTRPVGNLWGDLLIPIGRESEAAEVVRLFEAGERLITLMGPPGIGKTTLARFVGQMLTTRSRGDFGVWFCDLTEVQSLEGILTQLLSTLGGSQLSGSQLDYPSDSLDKCFARQGSTLYILDNFERLSAHAGATLGRWLARFPALRFLVTSREQLPLETGLPFVVSSLGEPEAVALFIERARAQRQEFLPSPQQLRVVHQLVKVLDGLPLAIELAASRISILTPEQILDRLKARFDLLRRTRPGQTQRHDSMRRAIDASWEMLSAWERDAFVQLGVFRGGFTLPAAEAVLDLSGHADAPAALDAVQVLLSRSLIHTGSSVSDPVAPIQEFALNRFNLYESIREYAVEKLAQAPFRRATEQRHALFYLAQAEALSSMSTGYSRDVALEPLTTEQSNFSAMYQTLKSMDPELLTRAALALHNISLYRESRPVRLARLEEAMTQSVNIEPRLRIRLVFEWCFASLVVNTWSQEAVEGAQAALKVAVELAEAHGDQELEARGLYHLGKSYINCPAPSEGFPYLERALRLTKQLGLKRLEILVLLNLAALYERATPLTGEPLGYEAAELARQGGYELLEAVVSAYLLECEVDHSRFEAAVARASQIMLVAERHSMLEVQILTNTYLARMNVMEGKLEEAERHYLRVTQQLEAPGNPVLAGIVLCEWASVLHLMGRLSEALSAHQQGIEYLRRWYSPGLGQYYGTYSSLLADLGELENAEKALQEAERHLNRHANRRSTCFLDCCRHQLELAKARHSSISSTEDVLVTPSALAQACLKRVEALPTVQPQEVGEGPLFVTMFSVRNATALLRQALRRWGASSRLWVGGGWEQQEGAESGTERTLGRMRQSRRSRKAPNCGPSLAIFVKRDSV